MVASPCALVISIPATIVSAVANGARHGVLFKGGASLDAMASVRVVALDKTGTTTVGRPELLAVTTFGDRMGKDDLLAWVAAVEDRSEHHLSRAIVRAAQGAGLPGRDATDFTSLTGRGVRGRVEGSDVAVGRRDWIESLVGEPVPSELASWVGESQRS